MILPLSSLLQSSPTLLLSSSPHESLPSILEASTALSLLLDNIDHHGQLFSAPSWRMISSESDYDLAFPVLLSCLAGASTCVGAAVVWIFSPQQIQESLAFSLSLAASVMITVSVLSIGPECWSGVVSGWVLLQRVVAYGAGCAGYFVLSQLLNVLPEPETLFVLPPPNNVTIQPWSTTELDDSIIISSSSSSSSSSTFDKSNKEETEQQERSWRVALLLFGSLLAHNFPEGLCVAASARESPQLGMTVATGIMIHNIPEGIAIAVPCLAARPNAPWLAFGLASLSGLAEPMGAIVALLALQNTPLPLENVLAFVAGIMCMVAVWDLYPEAFRAHQQQQQRQDDGMELSNQQSIMGSDWSIVWVHWLEWEPWLPPSCICDNAENETTYIPATWSQLSYLYVSVDQFLLMIVCTKAT